MYSLIYKLAVLLCFLSFSVMAQTDEEIDEIKANSDVRNLERLSNELKSKHEINYKKALDYAKLKGWPIIITLPDGDTKILQGITDDLQPIYYQTLNRGVGITSRANKLYDGGGLGLAVHGESMTAGVWDSGDLRVTHDLMDNRAIQLDTSSIPWFWTHPVHVAGTIMGGSEILNSTRVRGIAFKSNVRYYQSLNDQAEATNEAKNGLLLSNHSYVGSAYNSSYDNTAQKWDQIMYLAPYYLSVWACGNAYGPVDKLTNVNKNGIAVGAVHEVLNYTGPSSVVAADFSSRGPSDDGRVKPDIVTKGVDVRSGYSGPDNYDHWFSTQQGTSMSAPGITGTLLLLQQHYVNIHPLKFMRASTLKGLALHTADEAGLNPGPDITFGWGLINAEKAANVITNNGGVSYLSEDSLANGSPYLRDLVASGTEPLVATICWTDLPGTGTSIDNDPTPKLVNDLDLRVISNGTTYYPWKLDLSNITGPAIQGDNDRDNIEKIEIPSPVAGQVYTLQVNHKGTLASNGQRFSVIVTGLEECVANRNIVSSVNAVSVDHQQASARILATNTVNANAEAVYHAGDEVLMTDGFTAISGSTYRAYIENCTNDYAARKAVVERPVVTYNIPRPKEEIALADNAVYPNPGNGIFNVRVAGLSEGFVQITNLKGTEFYNRKFKDQGELDVNIKNEAPGMYIVRVVSGNKVFTKTIVKF